MNPINTKIKISLLLIASMGVMSGISIVSSLPLISKTFAHIPHIEFLSKLMLTIPSIIIAIFAIFAGHIVHRFGRLKSLYYGMAIFIIGGTSGFYLNNFYAILIGRAILGIGVALIMTTSTALIGDYFDEKERHKFMSFQGMAVAMGGIIFISLGGFLAQKDWSYPFAIYFIPLLFLPLLLNSLYEPKVHKIEEEISIDNNLFVVYFTAFFVMLLFYMLPTQLPYLIINTLHGEPQTIGLVISTAMIFNALTASQYSKIKARLSYIDIYAITFFLFSLGLFFISQASKISELFYSTAFMGMAFGLLFVNTNAWFLSKVSDQKRAKASGVLTSSLFLGQFFSPIIFEPIVSRYQISGLFYIISILSFSISVVLVLKKFFWKNKYN